MKLIPILQRHLPRISKSDLRWRNFTKTTLQKPIEPFEIDKTVASIYSISSNPMFSLLGLCNNISSLKKIHALLILHGLTHDLLCQTKLVSLYGLFGHVKWARLVFNQIRNPDLYSWKVMIRWYFLNDLYLEILMFYNCMKQCLRENDNIVFSIVLKACTELYDIEKGMEIHCQIVKVGSPDSFVLTGLVDMYAKCGDINNSRLMFDEISDKNVVSWTSLIVGYVQNDCSEEGLVLFNKMKQCLIEPNHFTMGSLLTACTKLDTLHQGKWVHGYIIKMGNELNSFIVAALVDMYAKCGAVSDARLVFDELTTADLVPWTTMIVGYTQSNLPNEALMLFTDKRWASVSPNSVTIASILSACAQVGNLNLGRSVHGLGITLGLEDVTVSNALVHMYAKCRRIGEASYVFDMISNKDVIAWNSMITGYSQNGYAYEALVFFHRRRYYFALDAITLVSVLSACASLGALQVGCALHTYATKEGLLSSNIHVGTALLNMYSKCGDFGCARRVFDEMGEKNTVTWSAMMAGYGMHGDVNGLLILFGEMLKGNLEPNEVVFTSILSACSHTGMIGEGWKYFDSMCQEYHVVPSMKHYVCMIDLLSRADRIIEALEFIERMPVQADVRAWGAVLHGCRLHSRLDLGEIAASRMLELKPDSAGYYVLVSNFYALVGKWDKVNEMRELMKERGLSKFPGCSLVDRDNSVDLSDLRVASLR